MEPNTESLRGLLEISSDEVASFELASDVLFPHHYCSRGMNYLYYNLELNEVMVRLARFQATVLLQKTRQCTCNCCVVNTTDVTGIIVTLLRRAHSTHGRHLELSI